MYRVEIKPTALKELNSLPVHIIKKSVEIIDDFEDHPRPKGCKKLVGSKSSWRVRIGDYRILYEIDDSQKLVTVFRVLHRKEVYR